jgi:flagellar biosynthesis protein FliR
MPADFGIALPTLYAFMLVLARVSGVVALVPLPGLQAGPQVARIVLSIVMTVALYPLWPQPEGMPTGAGGLLMGILPEVAVGVAVGLAVSLILEAFLLGAQVLSLNAGYSFASTVDPTTQADSGVLVVFAQLAGGLVFIALGLDREVIRALGTSLEAHPAGATFSPAAGQALLRLGGDMMSLALRLALPAVALLILTDLALGLLGRLNAQLQLLTLAFPIKMMASLVVLSWIVAWLPNLMQGWAATVFGTLRQIWQY